MKPTPGSAKCVKECEHCGATFTARAERRFCSRPCAYKARVVPPRECPVCTTQFKVPFRNQQACSRQCDRVLRNEANTPRPKASPVYFPECVECGHLFCTRTRKKILCSTECRRTRNLAALKIKYHTNSTHRAKSLSGAHARRADKLGLGNKQILLTYLIERDNHCRVPDCQFPTRKVTPLGSTGPRRPSIDHITPLSKGGTHDLSNVQLAHTRCNLSKNNRGSGDQLALVG